MPTLTRPPSNGFMAASRRPLLIPETILNSFTFQGSEIVYWNQCFYSNEQSAMQKSIVVEGYYKNTLYNNS